MHCTLRCCCCCLHLSLLPSLSLSISRSGCRVAGTCALSCCAAAVFAALSALSRFTCRRCTIASPSLWADFDFSFKTKRERSTALRTLLVRYVVVASPSPSRRCSRNSYVLQLLLPLLLLLLFCCCCCCCVLRWLRSFFFVFYFLLTV